MLWLLLSIACTGEKKQITKPNPTDTGDVITDNTDTQYWTLGETQTCANPAETVTYRDASADFGYIGGEFDGILFEGGMALQRYQDQWWLWQLEAPSFVRTRNQSGEMIHVDPSSVPMRLYIRDIDQDGKDDLLLLGEYFEVVWSVLTPDQYQEVLLPFTPQFGIRDVGTVDIEGDGDLDLWVLAGNADLEHDNTVGWILEQISPGVFSDPYEYIDPEYFGAPFDGTIIDFARDGDPDLYICNDFGFLHGGNQLLENDNGTFVAGNANGADITTACMGSSFADMNSDGYMDIYLTVTGGHFLLLGSADGFVDANQISNLPRAITNTQMLWGAQIIDYNNDGLFDILAGSSGLTRLSNNTWSAELDPLWLMEQQSDNTFVEISASLHFPEESVYRTVFAYDINEDGVLDIFAQDGHRLAYVFLSESCTANNWIAIHTPSDSIVEVTTASKTHMILSTYSPGMAASIPPMVHIGLGNEDTIENIRVHVPWKGSYQLKGPIQTRQHITFTPP